jgi:hypothetical protein
MIASDFAAALRADADTLRLAADAVTDVVTDLGPGCDLETAAKVLDLSALNAISTALALARKAGWLEALAAAPSDDAA